MFNERNGIVHMVGPELGLTLPGKTVVCGDSHTATHGAFGALAFGIGTSEVEHVLATQTLWQKKPKTMGIEISGKLQKGVYAKDIISSAAVMCVFGFWTRTLTTASRRYTAIAFGRGSSALYGQTLPHR